MNNLSLFRSLPELTSKAYLIAMERLNQLYKVFVILYRPC